MYLERHIFSYVEKMLKQFKVILITGSRQVGKSTMLKEKLLSQFEYAVLDDFSELNLARRDPGLFFKNHKIPLIIDEVQRAPELFLQIKYIADLSSKKGRIVLTGSQSHKLIKEVSDSLAGRLCFIDMSSLSMREIMKIDFNKEFLPVDEYLNARQKRIKQYESIWNFIHRGSMPELINKKIEWESFYRSYIRTYLERDVSELINVKNLLKFNNFMKCLAARIGELINYESIARDVGVTIKTIQEWTSILESSGVIRLLHPYENNVTKRTVKTPKVYFMDTGLVCYLVGWTSAQVAMNGAMSGALFENFVISEIIKTYYNSGHDCNGLYFYRDKDQHEIDLLIEKDAVLYPVEIKKTSNPSLDMAKHFSVLNKISGKRVGTGCIVCQCEKKMQIGENIFSLPIEYI